MVTVLFVDLVGFTARAERLDPEDVRGILSPYYARVRRDLESFGGTVEKFIGDAIMAVFGAPVARGDDPERAVRSALAVRDAVAAMNDATPDLDLQVRIAVTTGEALVSLSANAAKGEGMLAGDVVNTASRLQGAAPINGILVDEETFRCTRSAVDYAEAEPVVAKGKQAPIRVWRAIGASALPGRRSTRDVAMLGRDYELGVLDRIWETVVAERRPQLVTLFGPAGIGKTRLTSDFCDAAATRGARVVRGRSLPYGENSAYGAFAQQVKQVAAIFDTDAAPAAAEKLERAVTALLGPDTREAASHIALLIGATSDSDVADRQTLFFSARTFVEALARERPTILLFEDLHCADGSLLDLVETFASRVRDVPLLLLTVARPDLLTARAAWGGGLPAYTALPLEPLRERESEELARQLLAAAGEPADAAEQLARTAEGNPLFIEELAASLAERTAIAAALPTSIRSIVAARLDALPPAERAVLLDASVVGKVFWRGALSSMSGNGVPLSEALDSLETRDFIRQEAVSRLQGDRQFVFKHLVIRDVAYATLPRAVRRERHAAAARFLETAVTDVADAAPALAYHWREAGEPDRAIPYFVAAAEQAGRGWAKEEAVRLYDDALALVPEDDRERRRELARRKAVALQAAWHLRDAEHLAGRGRAAGVERQA